MTNRDFIIIMNQDIETLKKAKPTEEKDQKVIYWMRNNTFTQEQLKYAADHHNMTVPEFKKYMHKFKTLYC